MDPDWPQWCVQIGYGVYPEWTIIYISKRFKEQIHNNSPSPLCEEDVAMEADGIQGTTRSLSH